MSRSVPPGRPVLSKSGIRWAIDRAIGFLCRQIGSGRYGLSCFGSDDTPRVSHDRGHVFTGFFVAEALGDLITEQDRATLLARILLEETDGVWGYSPPGPLARAKQSPFIVDADDTAYAMRTLRRLGVERSTLGLMRFHRPEAGCFSTFDVKVEPRLVVEACLEHNLMAHPEVNANVFIALLGTNAERFINFNLVRMAQANDGHWPSYFYPGPLFATYLFLDLIRNLEEFADARRKGIGFLLRSQNADGSWGRPADVYDTALAVNGLVVSGEFGQPLVRGVNFLLKEMADDGSWHSGRCIWEFHAAEQDVWKASDAHGAFASALCTMALRRCSNVWDCASIEPAIVLAQDAGEDKV